MDDIRESDGDGTNERQDEEDVDVAGASSASYFFHLYGSEGERERESVEPLAGSLSLTETSLFYRKFSLSPNEVMSDPTDQLEEIDSLNSRIPQNLSEILWAQSFDPPNFRSLLSDAYEHGQITLSSLLARDFASCSFDIFNEMVC
jgi:hypothetical protein